MIKRLEDWLLNIPVSDHVDWMCRTKKLKSGLTYVQPVRRVLWSILTRHAGNRNGWDKAQGELIVKFLHIMFRMEKLTGWYEP